MKDCLPKSLIPGSREGVLPWKCAVVTLLREMVAKSKVSCQLLWRTTADMYQDAGNIYTDVLCKLWHPFRFSASQGCTYTSQLIVLLSFCTASGTVCLCKFGFRDWGSLNAANLGFVLAEDQSPGYICIHITQRARDLILSIFTCLHIFWAFLHIYKWSELTVWESNCERLSHAGMSLIKAYSIWRLLRLIHEDTHCVSSVTEVRAVKKKLSKTTQNYTIRCDPQ